MKGKRRSLVVACAVALATLSAGPAVGAQRVGDLQQTQKLVGDELSADTRFPYSIEKDRGTVVAGAKWDDAGGLADSGSAIVYRERRGELEQQARLTSPDPVAGEEFGLAVEVSRDVILVGAPYCTHDLRADNDADRVPDDLPCPDYVEDPARPGSGRRMLQTESDRAGRVYAFARRGGEWRHEATLSAGEAGDAFGWSLGFDRNRAVISAPWADVAGTDSGASYVYRRHPRGTWTLEETLVPSGLATGDALGYGYATQIDGNTIVVGAFHHDHEELTDSGAAWVFRRRGRHWIESTKVVPHDASSFADFGHSVTVDKRTVLIGSPGRVADPSRPFPPLPVGAAYVFQQHGRDWVEQARLLAPDPDPVTVFGVSNTLQGDTAVVVAPAKSLATDDGVLRGVGAAYVFDRTGGEWVFRERLVHDDPAAGDTIHEAELEGDMALLGAAGKDGERGALYVFGTRS